MPTQLQMFTAIIIVMLGARVALMMGDIIANNPLRSALLLAGIGAMIVWLAGFWALLWCALELLGSYVLMTIAQWAKRYDDKQKAKKILAQQNNAE